MGYCKLFVGEGEQLWQWRYCVRDDFMTSYQTTPTPREPSGGNAKPSQVTPSSLIRAVTLSLERSTRNVYNRWLNQERNLKSFCNER